MIEKTIIARLNAQNNLKVATVLSFDEEDPYFIEMDFPDQADDENDLVWTLGRNEIYEAIYHNWPSGISDVIMIKFKNTFRIYLKNDKDEKCTLDLPLLEVEDFLHKTYLKVTHYEEQLMLLKEIDEIEWN